jgi:hypothetical protein
MSLPSRPVSPLGLGATSDSFTRQTWAMTQANAARDLTPRETHRNWYWDCTGLQGPSNVPSLHLGDDSDA